MPIFGFFGGNFSWLAKRGSRLVARGSGSQARKIASPIARVHLLFFVYHIKGKILYKGQLSRSCRRLNRFAGCRSESLFNRLVVAKHSNLVQFTQSNFFTNKTLSNLILFTCFVKLATAKLSLLHRSMIYVNTSVQMSSNNFLNPKLSFPLSKRHIPIQFTLFLRR